MSAVSRPAENLTDETPVELVELSKAIEALPPQYRATLQPAFHRVMESTGRRRKILQLVQEALSQLRLDMKYLVFDLEATRRERDSYRRQLNDMVGDNGIDESGDNE